MSLTEHTARPAVAGDEAPADRPVRMPAESPGTWSQLRSLSVVRAEGAADWADDDRLDELFSAWARAAVATDAGPDGFAAAADDPSRPAPAEPTAVPAKGAPPTRPEREPAGWPTLDAHDAHDAVDAGPTAADEARAPEKPVTAWSRTDDDIIPTRRRSRGGHRRWGRRRG
jgi:hypothetical protein